VAECGYELLLHPPYSPDLAPSDFFLFQLLNEYLSGTHFSSDNGVIASVEVFLQGQDESLQDWYTKAAEMRDQVQ